MLRFGWMQRGSGFSLCLIFVSLAMTHLSTRLFKINRQQFLTGGADNHPTCRSSPSQGLLVQNSNTTRGGEPIIWMYLLLSYDDKKCKENIQANTWMTWEEIGMFSDIQVQGLLGLKDQTLQWQKNIIFCLTTTPLSTCSPLAHYRCMCQHGIFEMQINPTDCVFKAAAMQSMQQRYSP